MNNFNLEDKLDAALDGTPTDTLPPPEGMHKTPEYSMKDAPETNMAEELESVLSAAAATELNAMQNVRGVVDEWAAAAAHTLAERRDAMVLEALNTPSQVEEPDVVIHHPLSVNSNVRPNQNMRIYSPAEHRRIHVPSVRRETNPVHVLGQQSPVEHVPGPDNASVLSPEMQAQVDAVAIGINYLEPVPRYEDLPDDGMPGDVRLVANPRNLLMYQCVGRGDNHIAQWEQITEQAGANENITWSTMAEDDRPTHEERVATAKKVLTEKQHERFKYFLEHKVKMDTHFMTLEEQHEALAAAEKYALRNNKLPAIIFIDKDRYCHRCKYTGWVQSRNDWRTTRKGRKGNKSHTYPCPYCNKGGRR